MVAIFTSKKLTKDAKFRISKSPSFKVEGEKVTIILSSNLLAPSIKFLRGAREYFCENRKLYGWQNVMKYCMIERLYDE